MRRQNSNLINNASTTSSRMQLLCYLFIIITIVSSDVLWVKVLTTSVYEKIAQYVYIGIVCIVVIVYYILNKHKVCVSTDSIFFSLTILSLFFASVLTEDSVNAYIFKAILIIGGYYGARLFSFDLFYQSFRRIMLVLMFASFILYFMKLTGIGYSLLPVNTISTGVSYSTIGLANIYNNDFYLLPRAQSIFWEPGVYAAYLCIVLLFELFYYDKVDIKYISMVLLSVAITLSTTGYLLLILILVAYTLSSQKSQRRTKMIITVLLGILFLVLVYNENILSQLTYKFTNTNSESFKDRWLSIGGNILAIKESPILGIGPNKAQVIVERYIRSQGLVRSINNLNTILANYSSFGLLTFVYYLFHLFKFCFRFKLSIIGKILVLVSVVFLLSSTGYQYSPFFTLVFMLRFGGQGRHTLEM